MSLCDATGVELGRGLVNFSSEDVSTVAGSSRGKAMADQLGFPTMDEVVHRWVCVCVCVCEVMNLGT